VTCVDGAATPNGIDVRACRILHVDLPLSTAAGRMLTVDDQVIHGYTLASFISALRDEAADVVGVLCLIEDAAGTGRSRVESTGVALCAVKTL
jgi:adenine/guanine phosphoribosyltransferase-like PRPP-binding protein